MVHDGYRSTFTCEQSDQSANLSVITLLINLPGVFHQRVNFQSAIPAGHGAGMGARAGNIGPN